MFSLSDCLAVLSSVQRKHNSVKKYLLKNYGDIIADFKSRGESAAQPPEGGKYPIWVCWWQGAEQMPPLVKSCYASLQKHSNGHPVTLITQKNFREFTELPDYIPEKIQAGQITLTHLSDILRMNLLRRHGGLWLDATVLLTRHVPDFDQALFTIKRRDRNQNVAQCRWSAYLWYMTKNNLLAEFLDTLFLAYWRKENTLLAYFLIDYCVAVAYENIPAIRALLDAVPYNNPQIYALSKKLNDPYDPALYAKICADTYFHKLNWKKDYVRQTKTGAPTFYGFLTSTM